MVYKRNKFASYGSNGYCCSLTMYGLYFSPEDELEGQVLRERKKNARYVDGKVRDVSIKDAVFFHGAIGSSAGINIDDSTA